MTHLALRLNSMPCQSGIADIYMNKHNAREEITMLKASDFKLDEQMFHFRKDGYPLAKIRAARLKQLTWLDNLAQMLFWMLVFSGALWLAIQQTDHAPLWLIVTAAILTLLGLGVALNRCARCVLQIEFCHIDETGVQWVTVARGRSVEESELLVQQTASLNQRRL